jgi:hypothetical protein
MRGLPAVALSALALAAPPASADPGTLSGRITDGTLPAAGRGQATLRAVRLTDGEVVAATDAGRSGAWTLKLEPGNYVLATSVVRVDKVPVSAITAVQRVRGGRTTRTNASLKRTKTPPARRKPRKSARAASMPTPAVAVTRFSATGPNSQAGRGLSQMLQTELVNSHSGDCEPTVVEWEHRGDLQDEIDLANSTIADPSSRIPRGHFIDPAVFVRGSVATTSSSTSWSIQLVDAHTGNVLGEDTGTAAGAAIFDAPADIAQRLADQLCGGDYKVEVRINATVLAPPYVGDGLATAEVFARSISGTTPPTLWMGQGPVTFQGLQYGGVPECAVVAGAHLGYAKVEINPLPPDMIEVTWGGETDGQTTVICPDAPPIPLGVPPIMPFMGTYPTLLVLPAAGGTQNVSGGLAGGAAWTNSGTITVTRIPRGALGP